LQKELAKQIGCDQMTIVNWEKNHCCPLVAQGRAVVEFLGYDPFAKGALQRENRQLREANAMAQSDAASVAPARNENGSSGAQKEEKTDDPSWSKRLLAFRKARGMTQKHCARLLKVDPSTLARWERGEREPAGALLDQADRLFTGAIP